MARKYELLIDVGNPDESIFFQRIDRAGTAVPLAFPQKIYAEAAMDVTFKFYDGDPSLSTTPEVLFQSGDTATMYGKVEDTPAAIAPVPLATPTPSPGVNEVVFEVPNGAVDPDWSRTSGEVEYPVAIWINITIGGKRLISKTNVQVIDSEHVGNGDQLQLDAAQLTYQADNPTKWLPFGGDPSTVAGIGDYLVNVGKADFGVVESATDDEPAVTPAANQYWVVPVGATGAWVGQDGNIARRDKANSVYDFLAPFEGQFVFVRDTGRQNRYDGATWNDDGHANDHSLLTNLGNDDHTQYSLIDGTRNFTGTIGGLNAVSGTDFVPLAQVQTLIASAELGKTDKGTVDTRAVNPPAHGTGVRVLIDTMLGAPAGDFVGHGNAIAESDGVSVWTFLEPPLEGWSVWVDDENKRYDYDDDGSVWFASSAGETNTMTNVGVGISQFKQKTGVNFEMNDNLGIDGISTSLNGGTNNVEYGLDYTGLSNQAAPGGSMRIAIDNAGTIEYVDWTQLPTGDAMTNVGVGLGVFKQQVGNTFELRSFTSANVNAAFALNGDDIELTVPNATEGVSGASRLATSSEVDTAALTTVAVSPANINEHYARKSIIPSVKPTGAYTTVDTDNGLWLITDNQITFHVASGPGINFIISNDSGVAQTMVFTGLTQKGQNPTHTKIAAGGSISCRYESTTVIWVDGATEA